MRSLLLFVAAFFFCGCFSAISPHNIATKTMNQEAFPKDLASPGYTLLIMKWDKEKGPYAGPKWEKAVDKTSK
ncbi:MAG: hypothetical protein EOO10_23700, partial [Chitinophagaceae bacterium]